MGKRFVSIWFRHLTADWMIRRHPELKDTPFVVVTSERGRMVVKAVSAPAQDKGIALEMVVADCRAILPELQVFNEEQGKVEKLLTALAEWCIRFTPVAAVDIPDGLLLDVSGCAHLWGGEQPYLKDIITRISAFGYHIRAAMADTVGAAWAIARYGMASPIIESGGQMDALMLLPPAALRLEPGIVQRLEKLGLYDIRSFIHMPRRALRRRFGDQLLSRLDQALGQEIEVLDPVVPLQPYQERLPSLDPIRTAGGIEVALRQLLVTLCLRLTKEEKGIRKCDFKGFRIDGNIQQIGIGTVRASRNVAHLFKLFEIKIPQLEPALGFELFVLDATTVEDVFAEQETFWHHSEHNDLAIAELLDKVAGKVGLHTISRYLPDEHYWPERSFRLAVSLAEKSVTTWRTDLPRPIHVLRDPEPIVVTVPIPDYPPMLFIYKSKLHNITNADGPERIEQEWWLNEGLQRDYYCVEDESGARYWIFRAGHYGIDDPQWFIHGFFV